MPAPRRIAWLAAAHRGLAALVAAPASAQTVVSPKAIQLIIGFGPGGNYDLWGRTLSRHYGKHLPGRPAVVPQYRPGDGRSVAAGHMANLAARAGSVIARISRGS